MVCSPFCQPRIMPHYGRETIDLMYISMYKEHSRQLTNGNKSNKRCHKYVVRKEASLG